MFARCSLLAHAFVRAELLAEVRVGRTFVLRCRVRTSLGRLLIAALLTLSVGACVAEFSGRWDQTIQDANDEAGVIAIMLCVGAALLIVGAELQRIQPSRGTHPTGQLMLVGCAIWMTIGILVMKKMINFDF